MSAKKAGLGRGLGAFGFDNAKRVMASEGITILPLADIVASPRQARQVFDEDALQALADSIRQYGVVQPVVVRPFENGRYELIAGERRWRASKLAGLTKIPALVRSYETGVAAEVSLIENIQRENLNAIEEGAAYKLLADMSDLTQEQLAFKVGKSRSHVANMMRLLALAPPVRMLIENNSLSMGQARPLLQLKTAELQVQAAEKIIAQGLSARQAELLVKQLTERPKEKNTVVRDAHLEALQDRLKICLGTNVSIRVKNKNKGKIEIAFSSADEFERLISLLTEEENRAEKGIPFSL